MTGFGSGGTIDLKKKTVDYESEETKNTAQAQTITKADFHANINDKSAQSLNFEDGKCFRSFSIDSIINSPFQVCEHSQDEVQYLIDSINTRGSDGRTISFKESKDQPGKYYPIFGGHRFLNALRSLGKREIWGVEITKHLSSAQELDLIVAENNVRNAPNMIATYKLYQNIIDMEQLSHREIANRYNTSKSAVTNAMKMQSWPAQLLDEIAPNYKKFGDGKMTVLSQLVLDKMNELRDAYLKELREICQSIIISEMTFTVQQIKTQVKEVKNKYSTNTESTYLIANDEAKKIAQHYSSNLKHQ